MTSSSSQKFFCIIPAGGLGTRMGTKVPKLFLEYEGVPILLRTLQTIKESGLFDLVVIPVSKDWQNQYQDLVAKSELASELAVLWCVGGQTRQESVKEALLALHEHSAPSADSVIVVHDGARCFVSPSHVSVVSKAALSFGAVTSAVRCVDTVVRQAPSSDNPPAVKERVPREDLWLIHTPQAFLMKYLWEAHMSDAGQCVTDDASLVQELCPVRLIEGERANLKVTTADDLLP